FLILLSAACATPGTEVVRGMPPLDRTPAAEVTAEDFASGIFHTANDTGLPYRLLSPLRVEPGKQYPLVVHFHNSGAIGSDNRAQIERDVAARAWALPHTRLRHAAFVLVPQFSERSAEDRK